MNGSPLRGIDWMRPGGFEPPTRGLEGRRSSTELRARVGEGYRRGALAPDAEIGRDDRDRLAAEGARGRLRVHGGDADLAPALGEDVRAVMRTRHPQLERALR